MTDADAEFARHDAFEPVADGFRLTTTVFDGRVRAEPTDSHAVDYEVTVRVPTLSAATEDHVATAVEDGWFDTFTLRLADADGVVRDPVSASCAVAREGETAVVTYRFKWGDPDRAAAIAKALAEYVEGTYVEGIVPGYDYVEPVASLLAGAAQGGGQGPPL